MNLSKKIIVASLCISFSVFGIGCGGEEEKTAPVVQERPKPKPKPKPKAKRVSDLSTSLSIDSRIYLPEDKAPRSESQRVAILTFFNAVLQVDIPVVKSMLSFADQVEFDAMVADDYASIMNDVTTLLLETGVSPEGKSCVMAIYEFGLEYQMQLWYFESMGDSVTFDAVATPPDLVNLLDGNWIEQYFEYKTELAEIALQPDEDSVYLLVGELKDTDGQKGGGRQPGGPTGPGGPVGPGGPRGPGGPAGPR